MKQICKQKEKEIFFSSNVVYDEKKRKKKCQLVIKISYQNDDTFLALYVKIYIYIFV